MKTTCVMKCSIVDTGPDYSIVQFRPGKSLSVGERILEVEKDVRIGRVTLIVKDPKKYVLGEYYDIEVSSKILTDG